MIHEVSNNISHPPRSRFSREFFLLIGLLLACAAIFTFLYNLFAQPQYIRLDVPPPDPNQRWPYTEETVWNGQYSNKQYFIWKVETEVSNLGRDSILNYFDQWLTTHHWKRIDRGSLNGLCGYLPGKDLRDAGVESFVAYVPIDNSDVVPRTTCIGLRQVFPKSDAWLSISVITINPSPLTKIIGEFEP